MIQQYASVPLTHYKGKNYTIRVRIIIYTETKFK